MTETSQKPIKTQSAVQGDVDGLLEQLKKAFQEKEDWFAKKEELKKTIASRVTSLKTLRTERDSFNTSIKQAKIKRKEAHKVVKKDLSALQQLEEERAGITTKRRTKGSPGMLRKRIEQLEIKVETEAMSFDKEKKLMKEINKLRKELHVAASAQELSGYTREVSKEMQSSRRQANKIHRSIQSTAKKSQERHLQLLASFKEIRKLEKEQEQAFNKFVAGKRACQELQKQLSKAKVVERKKRKGEQAKKRQGQFRKQKRDQSLLAEKAKVVEDKLKSKGKLTTEDLLVLQGLKK